MKEHFPHDVCPNCGNPSVPAEGVPDQALRGCKGCSITFEEDLSRAATMAKPHIIQIRTSKARKVAYVRKCNGAKLVPTLLGVLDEWAGYEDTAEFFKKGIGYVKVAVSKSTTEQGKDGER